MAPKPHAALLYRGNLRLTALLPHPHPNPNPDPDSSHWGGRTKPIRCFSPKARFVHTQGLKAKPVELRAQAPSHPGPPQRSAGWMGSTPPLSHKVPFPAWFLALLPGPHLEISPSGAFLSTEPEAFPYIDCSKQPHETPIPSNHWP